LEEGVRPFVGKCLPLLRRVQTYPRDRRDRGAVGHLLSRDNRSRSRDNDRLIAVHGDHRRKRAHVLRGLRQLAGAHDRKVD
jgi:hypothetical protein